MHIPDDLPGAVTSADTARDLDGLVAALYPELRRLARHERLRVGAAAATLQTTALLNEVYLKLSGHAGWQTQAHFLGVAAKAMRHVLVDAARDRLALKRGAGIRPESLDAAENIADERKADDEMIRLGEALESLGTYDPMLVRVVECRFFGGMTEAEIADALGISERAVRRHWLQAKAWIHRQMQS